MVVANYKSLFSCYGYPIRRRNVSYSESDTLIERSLSRAISVGYKKCLTVTVVFGLYSLTLLFGTLFTFHLTSESKWTVFLGSHILLISSIVPTLYVFLKGFMQYITSTQYIGILVLESFTSSYKNMVFSRKIRLWHRFYFHLVLS